MNGWVNINNDNIVIPGEHSGNLRDRAIPSTQRSVTFEGQNGHVREHPHPQHAGDGGVILDPRSVQIIPSDGLDASKLTDASREDSFGGTSATSIRTLSVADSSLQSTSTAGRSVKSYPRKTRLTKTNSRTDLAIEKAAVSQLSHHSLKGAGAVASRRRERRESEHSTSGSGGSGSGIRTIVHHNGVQSRSNSVSTKSESAQGSIVQHLGTPTMYINEGFSQKNSHTSSMTVKNNIKSASPPIHINPEAFDTHLSSDPKSHEPYLPFSDSHDFIPYSSSKSLSNPNYDDIQTRFGTTPNTTNTSSRPHSQYLSNIGLDIMEDLPMKTDYNDHQSNLTLKERMGATLSCLHCEETNKRMTALQTDLEYLRAKALQGEFTCVECKKGISGHISSSDGGMRSRSSTASLSSVRSGKHSVVSKSSKVSAASSHSISSRTSRRSSKSILSKAQETSPSLMKIQKQFQNTNERHKAEMKEKSQAHVSIPP